MICKTRSQHRVRVENGLMICNFCGAVVAPKLSLRDRWHALRERIADWIRP